MADPKGKAKQAPARQAPAGRETKQSKAKVASSRKSTPAASAGDKPAPKQPARRARFAEAGAAEAVKGAPRAAGPQAAAAVAPVPASARRDPIRAMMASTFGGPPSAPPRARLPSWLYDVRFPIALLILGVGITGIGVWQLNAHNTGPSSSGPALPGNGLSPGDGVALLLAAALVLALAVGAGALVGRWQRRARAAAKPARASGKGWRWAYDTRVVASVIALGMVGYGFSLLAPPGMTPDLREIPGEVSNALQGAAAQPESGYPRIKLNRVAIDLLLVKGDGQAPPVKYEAFTFPGADHLLDAGQGGGSNSYVYAHARTGMFWRLHDLHIGDLVDVDYGGGKLLHYRVSEIHPSVNWKDFSWLQPTGDDRLTLQTCNGWRDVDPRFIVVARRIPAKIPQTG